MLPPHAEPGLGDRVRGGRPPAAPPTSPCVTFSVAPGFPYCGSTFVCPRFLTYILSALKRISLIVQLLGSLQATAKVGDPLEGLRSRFQVDKAF